LSQTQHIFFLGIGGIGMSALARYFHKRNYQVSGYDRTRTHLTEELEKLGMYIFYLDDTSLIQANPERVIWTPAIPRDSNLYTYFLSKGTEMQKRSEVLGYITSQKKNIAIAGTHGKTSTSTVLAHLLAHVQFPFTAFLGGVASNYNTNYIDLGDDWMLEEADEYDRSFLKLSPDIAIIGSLDADHLDIYNTRTEMVKSYIDFAKKIKSGFLLMSNSIQQDDINSFRNKISADVQLLSFGFGNADVHGEINQVVNSWTNFSYHDERNRELNDLTIRFPGKHNIYNALAAIRVALELGLEEDQIREGLLSFKGIQRRFEWIHEGQQVLIDDYAHHPEELKAAIQAVKDCYPNRKVLGIFQPHLYSRTRDFAQEFARELDTLDEVILVELYPARELPIGDISSHTILNLMKNQHKSYLLKSKLIEDLQKRELDVVLLLGAGDLSDLRINIKNILK
jgi:UDP-N-acetylmuramate--alanine ligase